MTGLLPFELSRIGNLQSFNLFKCFGVFCLLSPNTLPEITHKLYVQCKNRTFYVSCVHV